MTSSTASEPLLPAPGTHYPGERFVEITGLTTYAVQGRHWPRFPWILVEVTTDADVTGVGEGLSYKSGGLLDALRALGYW